LAPGFKEMAAGGVAHVVGAGDSIFV